MVWPAAEIEVDEDLIRTLLRQQHPDLADLPLKDTAAGWDNFLWRLGPDLLVRLPRRAEGAALILHEQRWLPELAPRLPLPVPAPVRCGRPGGRYPWAWSVVPWLAGTPGDRSGVADPDDAAVRLGSFLRALHQPAPSDVPENPWRGGPLTDRHPVFDSRLALLSNDVDGDGSLRVWDRALAAKQWSGPPLWLHGDMHRANILMADGTVAAVIDFGDLCRGDPAADLAGAWMLLPPSAMAAFAAAYGGIDDDLEHRALGWAALFALNFVAIGLDGHPTYGAIGHATVARVISRSDEKGR